MKQFSIPKLINFVSWDKVPKLSDFTYPWHKEESPLTTFSAYYDEKNLYFQFIAYGPEPLVFVEKNNKMEVIHSERVEMFFRADEKMHPYYCLEMDPYGRVLDYKAELYRKFNRNWQWPKPLSIETEIQDQKYTLQGKISLATLKQLNQIHNDQIQVGLFRGHCTKLEGKNAVIKWISWIDSKTPEPDFHVPSAFGILKLS